MGKIGGLALIAAGLGVAAYTIPWQEGVATLGQQLGAYSARPDSVRSAATGGGAAQGGVQAGTGPNEPRLFSSNRPLLATPEPAAQPSRPVAAPVAGESTWRTVVTSATEGSASVPAFRTVTSKLDDGDKRAALVSDIQRELKRVGCFAGDIGGNWDAESRKAMSTFIERVNASLPTGEPDYILLTLLQGHAAKACGAACPTGQGLAASGKCVPNAILASGAAGTGKPPAKRAAELPGRMAIGGPASEVSAVPLPRSIEAPTVDGWRTTATPAPAEARSGLPKTAALPGKAVAAPPVSVVAPAPPVVEKPAVEGAPRPGVGATASWTPVPGPGERAADPVAAPKPAVGATASWTPSPAPGERVAPAERSSAAGEPTVTERPKPAPREAARPRAVGQQPSGLTKVRPLAQQQIQQAPSKPTSFQRRETLFSNLSRTAP